VPGVASNVDERHLAFDVRLHRDVQHLTHAGQPRAVFDDLLDGSIIATRYYRDARPLWVRCLSTDSVSILKPRALNKPTMREKLAWLVSNYN